MNKYIIKIVKKKLIDWINKLQNILHNNNKNKYNNGTDFKT